MVGSWAETRAMSVAVDAAALSTLASTVRTPMTPTRPMQVAVARPADQILSAGELRRALRAGLAVTLTVSGLVIVATFVFV